MKQPEINTFQKLVDQYTIYGLIIAILLMFMGKLLSRRRKDRNEIDCLKQEMTVIQEKVRKRYTILEDRILFLEKVPLLLSLIKDGIHGIEGISVKDLIKMIEHGFHFHLHDPYAFHRYISFGSCWNCWNEIASEEELLEISFFIAKNPLKLIGPSMIYITFAGGVSIYGGINDNFEPVYHSYNKKIEQLRDCRSKQPYSDHNKYFDRIENVLNALYKEKLLQ